MPSFSNEFIKRKVVDSSGELLGVLEDIVIDPRTGDITEIMVKVEQEIDVNKLPWAMKNNLCAIPAQEVREIEERVVLRR